MRKRHLFDQVGNACKTLLDHVRSLNIAIFFFLLVLYVQTFENQHQIPSIETSQRSPGFPATRLESGIVEDLVPVRRLRGGRCTEYNT